MKKPPLDLQRLWRDTRLAPDPDVRGHMGIFADRDDLDSMAHFGFYVIDSLSQHACVFLRGRPGSGKSAEIDRIERGDVSGFRDEHLIIIRCKEAGTDLAAVIRQEPKWKSRLSQQNPVRLILDGLDEGFLREGAYFDRLKYTLTVICSEHPGLRLLVTCRPAELDKGFVESVHEIWAGIGEPAVFALEPLSPDNQQTLLTHWNVRNSKECFQWIRHNRFEEFALWPRSLEWLAEQFRTGHAEELNYTDLCRLRIGRGFGEDKRLSDARPAVRPEAWSYAIMLLAATLVCCGRKGITFESTEPDCLSVDEVFRSDEVLEIPTGLSLSREDVRGAVQTSNLIEAHKNYFRFENQSDLEFLAGALLGSFGVEHLEELLGAPDHDGSWRVFPQLATTAANLAAQSPEFFNYLLARDPRVLMRVDFASKSETDRRAAIGAMLEATARVGATGEHDQHAHFSTLRHSQITAQLHPWIFDKKKPFIVRELAFDIAERCCGIDLWQEFEDAAASGDEFSESKLPSLVALFGKSWPEEKLRAWASSPQERLAGAALNALLDRGYKLRDLVSFLHEPSNDVFSLYHMHLNRLQRQCAAEDVPSALEMIAKWRSVGATHGDVRDLACALIAKGVAALDRDEIRAALTKFIISRYEDNDWLLGNSGSKCGLDITNQRQALLIALSEDWPANSQAELLPFTYPLPPEDYPWLLNAVASMRGSIALAKYAASLVWQFDETLRDPLERAYAASPVFRAQLPTADKTGIFATLKRLRAESEAKYQLRLKEIRVKRNRPDYDHAEHLSKAIADCRAGRVQAWTEICFALSQPKDDRDAREFFRNIDPRRLAGWVVASEDSRSEMTEFARQFLLHCELPTLEPRTVPWEFFGVAYALNLHANRLGDDKELLSAVKPMWALALLRHCSSEGSTLADPLAALRAAAPSVVADACRQEFRERWNRNESVFDQLFAAAWCTETERVIADELVATPLQPETYISGLGMLSSYSPKLAQELATQQLVEHAPRDDSAARRAALGACLFVTPNLWENAWPHLLADRSVARKLLLEYSSWLDFHGREQRIAELPDKLVAALFGLMSEIFPTSETPRHSGGYTPTGLDDAYSLLGHLQRLLESRGRHAELSAVYQNSDETRSEWWTHTSVDRAQNAAHAQRREPPTASEFIKFLTRAGGTFVRDNDSLQRAVLHSLQRFERQLKPDGLHALWEKGKPRSEEVLQQEIVRHLRREFEDRRIVVNMETKVLREHSDIRVQADPYVVTIEVKLGHSKDRDRPLRTAMRSQLRTYLENQSETHGIYVVGWFFCSTFRSGAPADLRTLRSARNYFDAQARKLSKSGFVLTSSVIDCSWPTSISSRNRKISPRSRVTCDH